MWCCVMVITALAVSGAALVAVLVALALGAGRPRAIKAGAEPVALVVTPDGRTLYASDADDETVTPVTLKK